MPVCEGRPDGPCPDKRNDRSVHLSQGDLMLCDACEKVRFPCVEAKDRKPGSHAGTQKKVTENRTQRLGSDSAASRPAVPEDEHRSTVTEADRMKSGDAARSTSTCTVTPEVVINELLTYVDFFRNKANDEALRRSVFGFYTPTDICCAKKTLIQKFHIYLESCPLIAERRNSSVRSAHEAEVDDICGIFDLLDTLKVLNNCIFVAANLENLPKFGPEELNIAAVIDRQVLVEATVKDMSAAISQLTSHHDCGLVNAGETSKQVALVQTAMESLNQKFDSLYARFDHLNDVCANAFQSATSQRGLPAAASADVDRSLNIVVFGVKEDRTP